MGLVRSGLEGGIPCAPKLGKSAIWFRNISSTVSFFSRTFPVVGEMPSLSKVASTSFLGCGHQQPRIEMVFRGTHDNILEAWQSNLHTDR